MQESKIFKLYGYFHKLLYASIIIVVSIWLFISFFKKGIHSLEILVILLISVFLIGLSILDFFWGYTKPFFLAILLKKDIKQLKRAILFLGFMLFISVPSGIYTIITTYFDFDLVIVLFLWFWLPIELIFFILRYKEVKSKRQR